MLPYIDECPWGNWILYADSGESLLAICQVVISRLSNKHFLFICCQKALVYGEKHAIMIESHMNELNPADKFDSTFPMKKLIEFVWKKNHIDLLEVNLK